MKFTHIISNKCKGLLVLPLLFSSSYYFSQGVAINENGANPNANAILDVDADGNDKGMLIPRLSTGQRTGIAGLGVGEEGLTVYDETTNSYWLWDGAQWIEFTMAGKAWELRGNSGTVAGTDFIGTLDAVDWVIKTNNVERVRVESGGRVEFTNTTDATGTAGSGVIEVANSLRIDGNEIITNDNSPLYLQNDNNGDLIVDANTLFVDASTNRIGVGINTPAYTVQTLAGGTVSVNDGYVRQVRALYLQDWDDNTGGVDDKYRLLGRDGAWMFYNGGVVVGNYGNGTWGDLADGQLIVEDRVGIRTTAPTRALDINGTIRIRGGGATAGDMLMCQDGAGNATWSSAGYGLIPIGSIVGWHGNMAGVPGLPSGWLECNGQTISDAASPMNGQVVPNLNGGTTSKSGDASRGRFLRGHTTSGLMQTDESNNFQQYHQDDADGGPNNVTETIDDDGNWTQFMSDYNSDDRMRFRAAGVETRVTNMSVRWIIRVK